MTDTPDSNTVTIDELAATLSGLGLSEPEVIEIVRLIFEGRKSQEGEQG